MIDTQRPSTWRPFHKNLCKKCWAGCCTLPLEVTTEDLVRLNLITPDQAQASPKNIARDLTVRRLIQFHQPKTEKFTIAQRAGRDCIFLDDQTRRCTVYDKRPEVCRVFPQTLGPRPGFCPAKTTPP